LRIPFLYHEKDDEENHPDRGGGAEKQNGFDEPFFKQLDIQCESALPSDIVGE
jgi:hypothetical protein